MTKRTKAQPSEVGTRMYCGPDIPGVANPGMLFSEPPPLFKEHMENCPALRGFVVAPADYARIKQKISSKGSLENTQYRKALEYLQQRR